MFHMTYRNIQTNRSSETKCLYVWLGCAAMLPRETLVATFGTDRLLDDAERGVNFAG